MHRAVIILLALVLNASAATYYVDQVGGSDSNPGTSVGSPFKYSPGDFRATSTAAATSLAAGDTVIFKGGVAYDCTRTNAIVISLANGTSGNRITYDGNTADTFGTGKAIMTDSHKYYGDGAIGATVFGKSSSASWIKIQGFHFYEMGGAAILPVDPGVATNRNTGAGINFAGGVTGGADSVIVSDCWFDQLGYYFWEKPMQDSAISGVGIQSVNFDGLTITNCDFSRVSIAIEAFASTTGTNLTVIDCTFHDAIRWMVDLASGSSSAKFGAINIKRNRMWNFGQFGSGSWTGYGEWPHVDGVFLRCDYPGTQYSTNTGATGINIEANSFGDTNQLSGSGTSAIYVTSGPSANIFNNVFTHTLKSRTIYLNNTASGGTTPQVVRIAHNTFFEGYQTAIDIATTNTGTRASVVDIRNNLLLSNSTNTGARLIYFQVSSPATNTTIDYNFYGSSNAAGTFYEMVGVETGGITAMRARGWETNGVTGWPTLVNESYGTGYQCDSNDFRQAVGSLAVDGGQTISWITTDALGNARVSGSAPDFGAYEGTNAPSGGGGGGGGGSVTNNTPRPFQFPRGFIIRGAR